MILNASDAWTHGFFLNISQFQEWNERIRRLLSQQDPKIRFDIFLGSVALDQNHTTQGRGDQRCGLIIYCLLV